MLRKLGDFFFSIFHVLWPQAFQVIFVNNALSPLATHLAFDLCRERFHRFYHLIIASTANATLTRSHLSVSFYALVMHWSFYGIIYSVIKRITKSRPQQFSSKIPSKICEQKKVTGRGVRVTKTMKTHTAKGIGRDEWRKKSSTFGLGQTRKRGSMPSWSEARSWIHRSLSASPSTGYCDRTLAR